MKKIRDGYKITELSEIPEEWDVKRISDITDIKTGGTPSTKNEEYWVDGDIPWMVSGDINKRFIYKVDRAITKLGMEKSPAKLLPVNTVMIALNGQGKTKGTVAYLETEVTCNQSLAGFIPNEHYISKYLYYNLQNRYLEIRSLAGDGARNGLNLGLLKDILIPLPSIQEQQKIALILSTIDEEIDSTDNLIEKTKELKKGIMQTLLTKGIGHERFKDTEIGRIPEEWEVKRLEEVCEFLDGKRKPIKSEDRANMQGNIPYYGASGIIDWVNDYIFDDEIILLGEDGENIKSRNVPLAFKVIGKCWVNNHAHVLKIIDENSSDFMTYVLESKDYSSYVIGSAQPKLNQAQCRKFMIQVPTLNEQKQIALILSSVDEKIDQYESKKEKLQELKKGLMQKLLTGKVRVKI